MSRAGAEFARLSAAFSSRSHVSQRLVYHSVGVSHKKCFVTNAWAMMGQRGRMARSVQSCARFLSKKAAPPGSGAVVHQHYMALVDNGTLRRDERQAGAISVLSVILSALADGLPAHTGMDGGGSPGADASRKVKGLYIYGEVGSGKSMMMNLFWEAARDLLPPGSVRRVHFHEFMLSVHADLHTYKETAPRGSPRAITEVAEMTAKKARVLCLDEFQVTDIADAAILAQFMDV